MNEEKYQRMLEVVKKYHAGQTREGGVKPYWPHCERTAVLLRRALENSHEETSQEQVTLLLAALGHDLYEDTSITRAEVKENFGGEVDALIEEATNPFGDGQAARYAQKFKTVSEPALLIKLADMCDNYGSGHMSLPENGYEWTREFLWPILEVQWAAVSNIHFQQFPKTAEFLTQAVTINRQLLEQALEAGKEHKVA